jgi:FkbM family methyltransferase
MHPSSLKHTVARYLSQHYPIAWQHYYRTFRKHHFEAEYWLIPLFCRRDKISVDIGANMGIFAFAMQRYSRAVMAFEPNTDLWPYLRRFLSGKVRLEDAALSGMAGQAEFRVVADNTGVATIEVKNPLSMIERPEAITTRPVTTRTLDSFALADVSFIKIDVEGHEEAVLAGAIQTIAANRPVVLVESEDRHNPGAPARVADWFSVLDYGGFYIKERLLWPVGTLSPEDTNPEGLSSGVYINNFIYIPREDANLVEGVRRAVEG